MAQHRVDLAAIDGQAALEALVQRGERAARLGHLRGRAGNGELVAARHQGDAEPLLAAREILIVLAEQERQQPVVGELQAYRLGDFLRPARTAEGTGRKEVFMNCSIWW